jgi:hypothetical protein
MNKRLLLFLAAFCQVGLVTINVYQIANKHYVGAFFVGFAISAIWSFSIKGIAFGDKIDRFVYCMGAAFGTSFGMLLSTIIY